MVESRWVGIQVFAVKFFQLFCKLEMFYNEVLEKTLI